MKTILIVEDEANVRKTISLILKREGYDVLVAEDGAQAIQLLKDNNDISLIITDINMPVMNGLEFIDMVRKVELYIPVIVISGVVDSGIAARLEELGCKYIIDKPFSAEQIIAAVDNAMDK